MKRIGRTSACALIGITIVAALGLTGCTDSNSASGSETTVSQSEINKAMNTPTTLTYWTWDNDMQGVVNIFEKKYPKIKVNIVMQTSAAEYLKLRTVLKAGKGVPDIVMIEYQYLPSFRLTNSLLNLAPYGARSVAKKFVPSIWSEVANDEGVWAIPQDSGPMINAYWGETYARAGITQSPSTWEDYAQDAAKIKSSTGAYMTNMGGNDPGQIVGLFAQAGSRPFGFDGKKHVTIDLANSTDIKVVTYWQNLIHEGLVSTDTEGTSEFLRNLDNGAYAGFPSAAWLPEGIAAEAASTIGKWRAAPLPQWSANENVSANFGGAALAVMAPSQNKIAAYEFAEFANTNPETTMYMVNKVYLFPTTLATLNSPEFTGAASPVFGGQHVNALFAQVAKTIPSNFEWLPFMDYVYSSYTSTLGDAITNKGDLVAGLKAWNAAVIQYAKQQGFTVN